MAYRYHRILKRILSAGASWNETHGTRWYAKVSYLVVWAKHHTLQGTYNRLGDGNRHERVASQILDCDTRPVCYCTSLRTSQEHWKLAWVGILYFTWHSLAALKSGSTDSCAWPACKATRELGYVLITSKMNGLSRDDLGLTACLLAQFSGTSAGAGRNRLQNHTGWPFTWSWSCGNIGIAL